MGTTNLAMLLFAVPLVGTILVMVLTIIIACKLNKKYNPPGDLPFRFGYFLSCSIAFGCIASIISIAVSIIKTIAVSIIKSSSLSMAMSIIKSSSPHDPVEIILFIFFIIIAIIIIIVLLSASLLNANKYKIGAIFMCIFIILPMVINVLYVLTSINVLISTSSAFVPSAPSVVIFVYILIIYILISPILVVRLIYYYGKRWHELKNIPKSGTKNTTKNTNISEDKNTERRIEDDNKDISKKNIRTESVKGHDHQDVVKITLSNEKRILKLAETKKILTGTEIVKGTNLEVKDVVAALKRLHSIGLVKSVKRKDGRHVFDFS